MREEFVTSIGDSGESYVNLLFDRSIYRPMCTYMGNTNRDQCQISSKVNTYNHRPKCPNLILF